MNMPIDITGDIVSTTDWAVIMRLVEHRVRIHRHDSGVTSIICVQHYLRDALFEGWASVYLSAHFTRRDNLRTKLVKWVAKFLNVDISNSEQYKLSASQEAIQRLRDRMIERESLIVSGLWIKVVSI
jgi:hypothetical protein